MTRIYAQRLLKMVLLIMIVVSIVGGEGTALAQDQGKSRMSIGIGYGIPYGTFGINVEFDPILGGGKDSISEYYSMNVGVGFAVAGIGYSFGFSFYPFGRTFPVQPKLAIHYGVVGISSWDELIRGFALGVGVQTQLYKSLYVGSEIIFVINGFGYDISEKKRLKASAGLRWRLD